MIGFFFILIFTNLVYSLRSTGNFGINFSTTLQLSFLIKFGVSVFYLLLGVLKIIFKLKIKLGRKNIEENGKKYIMRGLAGLVVAFVLYFLLSVIANVCCIDYSGTRLNEF